MGVSGQLKVVDLYDMAYLVSCISFIQWALLNKIDTIRFEIHVKNGSQWTDKTKQLHSLPIVKFNQSPSHSFGNWLTNGQTWFPQYASIYARCAKITLANFSYTLKSSDRTLWWSGLTLLLRIQEVSVSNLDSETGYPGWGLCGFPHSLQANSARVP
jgi:hypothetical protein